jgi:hypothetical protein
VSEFTRGLLRSASKGRVLSDKQKMKLSIIAAKRTQAGNNNHLKGFKRGYVTLDRLGITAYYASSFELSALLLLDSYYNVINVSVGALRIPYQHEDESWHHYVPDLLKTYVFKIESVEV